MRVLLARRPGLPALLLLISLALPLNPVLAQPREAASAPRIDRFDIEPARRVTSARGLAFTLIGTPGAKASVSISGVSRRVFLSEVAAGVYEGIYSIRSNDRIGASTAITAHLRLGDASASLDRPLVGESPPGAARICTHCDMIAAMSLFRAVMTDAFGATE